MSELPHLDDFGRDIRYSRWDGTQRLDALEADELLGAMSDELLSGRIRTSAGSLAIANADRAIAPWRSGIGLASIG